MTNQRIKLGEVTIGNTISAKSIQKGQYETFYPFKVKTLTLREIDNDYEYYAIESTDTWLKDKGFLNEGNNYILEIEGGRILKVNEGIYINDVVLSDTSFVHEIENIYKFLTKKEL